MRDAKCKCCGKAKLSAISHHNVWVCRDCDRIPALPRPYLAGESGPEIILPLRRAHPDTDGDHA